MADLTKPMYGYWLQQPDILKHILENRKALVKTFVDLYQKVRPRQLFLVGSGTSLNGCYAAAPYLSEMLQIEVSILVSSRIPPIYCDNPMFVFLSQGGSSTNTLEAMEKLGKWPYVTITGEEESEIRRRSDHHMLIGCGEELAGPKTVGYTSSVLCLTLCALEAALNRGILPQQDYDQKITLLALAISNMYENLRRTELWFERNKDALLTMEKCVLVGKGSSADAAREGALKMLETVKMPVLAFEFEEYLHGPLLMTDENLMGMYFITTDAAVQPKMLELARCHKQFAKHTFLIGGEDIPEEATALRLLLTGQPLTECYEYVLAPQLVSARVPILLGKPDGAEIYNLYVKSWETKYNDGR